MCLVDVRICSSLCFCSLGAREFPGERGEESLAVGESSFRLGGELEVIRGGEDARVLGECFVAVSSGGGV